MTCLYRNYAGFSIKHFRRCIYNTTRTVIKENLPTLAYKPEIVEKHKYDEWERTGKFIPANGDGKPNFSMILPPPNVTGKLHLGHALSCTVQDVIARRHRSTGQNVLWMPGTDHAGIATQGVVEKYIKSKHNIERKQLCREEFIKHVWKWKEKYGNTIFDQLRILGSSLDWSRQIFTMDPRHTDAVNTAFIRLFKEGLIYRKKALVNWCNKLQSTVSDIEVDNVAIKGPTDLSVPGYDKPVKFGLIYAFAYKVVDTSEEIVVSTTMPETMVGDTAVAVNPNDERYKHLVGKRVLHPFRGVTIPIIADNVVDMKFGTGAVKITPAHSKVDYEIGKRHNLPLLQVIGDDGLMRNSDKFDKTNRYECRQAIIKALGDLGFLRHQKPHEMSLPMCSRTGDVIQHLPKEQWFLSCSRLNKKVIEYIKSERLKIRPEKFAKIWLQWAEDDRDWCISRQLWWGHQIPAYKCSVDKNISWVAATDVEIAKNEASKYLRCLPDDINAERDTDVLDTWFSSGIYPFAALGWPENNCKGDYGNFYPLSLMATAHDILGFWVHRMAMLGLQLTESLPFKEVLLHGVICDSKGAKMSKSKGNVIDPVDVIKGISLEKLRDKAEEMHKSGIINTNELDKAIAYHKTSFSSTKGIPECGVDALRFTLLSQDIKSHYVNFDVYQCNANKLFCNKIWQSIKYTQLSFDKLRKCPNEITLKDLTLFDKWILSRLSHMVEIVDKSIEAFDFHLATKAIKTLLYNEFCDVYLEATKSGFEIENVKTSYAHAHTLSAVLNTSLRCLAPFMVYLTDELIPKIPALETNIIYNFNDSQKKYYDWPRPQGFKMYKDERLEKQVDKLLRSMNLIREIKGLYSISNKLRPSIAILTEDHTLKQDLESNRSVILNLTRSSLLHFNLDTKVHYVKAYLDKDTEICVEVTGENINEIISSAKNKLEKKIKKLEDNVQKLENKYSTSHYLKSVPEWTQVQDKDKLKDQKEELKHLQRLIVD